MSGPSPQHQPLAWLSRGKGAPVFPRLSVALCQSMTLVCVAELIELGSSACLLAKHYGPGYLRLTCMQVAGLGMSDGPMLEIMLENGNHRFFQCILVRGSRRQLMQTSRTSAFLRSLAVALMALRLPVDNPSALTTAFLHAGSRMPSIRKEFRKLERPGRGGLGLRTISTTPRKSAKGHAGGRPVVTSTQDGISKELDRQAGRRLHEQDHLPNKTLTDPEVKPLVLCLWVTCMRKGCCLGVQG